MNYIQYMKPGSKFWALPNGQEDTSWSEFWNNWKEAIGKAKEQIVDNLENLKQDYKDAADPIAASERKQAESIEATRAKQASMKFVSDNRTDYEKKRDRKNLQLKEFEQKEQYNKDATDAVMWTLTGIPYAVQHLASPNGVVKTYGNTKAAVQSGGGPYIEKAVASAAGDVLDAAILAAPLFTPEARLARAINKNVKQGIQLGQYYHGSPNRNISKFKIGKDGGIYFTQNRDAAKQYTGTFGTGKVYNADLDLGNKTIIIDNDGAAWTKIPENKVSKAFNLTPQYVHDIIGSYNLGEVPWHYGFTKMFGYKPKSNYYAIDQVVKLGKDQGISSLIIKNAKDNGKRLFSRTMPYDQTVVYNPRQIILEGRTPNLKHYAPLPQTSKTTPTKTSLAFFERQPANISKAERLGISKGIKYYTQEENLAFRNQINNFAKKYGYEPIGDEVTDPEVLERYARSLIKRHNTFYRGVELNPKESNLSLEYMATHAPGGGSGELYITPYQSVAAMYGEPVEILRPYKLGSTRTKWFDEGDFQIYTAGGRRDMHLWENKKGITSPWLSSEEFEGKTSWIYKPHVETELTGRNQQFIPMSIQYRSNGGYPQSLTRVGSLAVPTTAFYKSGGTIHIKKKNKGKFAKVRDYVDYKNNK